jgi:hypothetical protein
MLLRNYFDLFWRPRFAFHRLINDRKSVRFGIIGNLVLAIVYFVAISIPLQYGVMHTPEFLVLNIPAHRYYAYERLFIFPVGIAGTILSAGVIRLVARAWNGKSRFEDLFALFGYSLLVVATVIGLPDLLIGVLTSFGMMGPLGFTFLGPHVVLGTLWYLALMVIGVREAEGFGWMRSTMLGALGFAVNGVVQFIFIR